MSEDLDEILTEACRLAGQALGTHLAKVAELRPDGKTLLVRAGVGWKPGVVGHATVIAEHDTSEGHALRTGEPMISTNIATEKRFKYSAFLIENNVRALANVVIIGGHGKPPFGILQIDSHVPRQFTESDMLFLRSYANLLASAVDRIRSIGDVRDAEARLRAVLEENVADRTRELTEANAKLQAEAIQRGRVEDTLRQSLKMEAVGQLTGGLAHDFNNLLASVSGSLELMRIRTQQGRTAELQRYIDIAMKSVDRAAALTQRLLAFSRRQNVDPKSTDMNKLISGLKDLFKRTVGPGIQIETRMAANLWPTLCDPNQLENAMLNLVINARDAMPDGGRLVIETTNSVFPDRCTRADPPPWGEGAAGEYVVLTISDTGVGMSPEVIARVFDPFFTTKPAGEGTGLGLTMTHRFVQQSSGHMLVSSDEGQGTKLSIYLPRHIGLVDGIQESSAEAEPAAVRGGVVLIVEDEQELRGIIAEALLETGFKVLVSENGQSGLQIVESPTPIDLLLTDVGLPGGMDGRQLAHAAREHRPDLKVLFVTGYAESTAVRDSQMEMGMEVMTKPFTLAALTAKVLGMISR